MYDKNLCKKRGKCYGRFQPNQQTNEITCNLQLIFKTKRKYEYSTLLHIQIQYTNNYKNAEINPLMSFQYDLKL